MAGSAGLRTGIVAGPGGLRTGIARTARLRTGDSTVGPRDRLSFARGSPGGTAWAPRAAIARRKGWDPPHVVIHLEGSDRFRAREAYLKREAC